jgi:hypothetical protein
MLPSQMKSTLRGSGMLLRRSCALRLRPGCSKRSTCVRSFRITRRHTETRSGIPINGGLAEFTLRDVPLIRPRTE